MRFFSASKQIVIVSNMFYFVFVRNYSLILSIGVSVILERSFEKYFGLKIYITSKIVSSQRKFKEKLGFCSKTSLKQP